MKTLIVAPMSREARAIPRDVFVCGSGPDAPKRVIAAAHAAGAECVIIAGVCGGLDPSLAPGATILSRRLVADGKPELTAHPELLEAARRALRTAGVPFVSSTLLTMEEPIASKNERTAAWNKHGAAGVDMETYGIAEALEVRGARWLALRAVVDPAGEALPSALLDWRAEEDEREILSRLLRSPKSWPSLVRLAFQMRSATRALSRAVPPLADATGSLARPGELREEPRAVQFISVQCRIARSAASPLTR